MSLSGRLSIVQEHLLRAVFPLVVTWVFLLVFINEISDLQRMNPFPEGGAPHSLYESSVGWLALLPVVLAAIWPLRQWPYFLRLPASVPLRLVAFRLVVHGTAWIVVVVIGALAVSYPSYDQAADHQGQYWAWAGAAALLYAAPIAPVTTLLTVWRSFRNKAGRMAG
ncbi:MAG: hypothetical protein HYX75_18630 [Acidobacteria bacterium]|nr:hypothetical protein [Acidobacteriota bacterium]